jgi:peptidyl-Lys metalloendopeptidase
MDRQSGRLEPTLTATLTLPSELARGEPVTLGFTLANQTAEDLRVLTWYTPLEGLLGEIFVVERDGESVPYRGILMKRGVPSAEDYVEIAAGSSASAEVEIGEAFDMSEPGEYKVTYRSPSISHVIRPDESPAIDLRELGPVSIPSDTAAVRIADAEPEDKEPPSPDSPTTKEAKQGTYANCTTTQQNTISQADTSASFKSAVVYSHLDGLSVSKLKTDALYKKWFGTYTATRHAKVLANWKKIQDAFGQTRKYNCKGPACKSSTYAYVYPGGDVEVFLCNQFWNAPDTGFDTKYGTLIHEISHEAAATKDHAYGQTSCANLATNDPDKATANADNYEYYAEEYQLPEGCGKAIKKLFGGS